MARNRPYIQISKSRTGSPYKIFGRVRLTVHFHPKISSSFWTFGVQSFDIPVNAPCIAHLSIWRSLSFVEGLTRPFFQTVHFVTRCLTRSFSSLTADIFDWRIFGWFLFSVYNFHDEEGKLQFLHLEAGSDASAVQWTEVDSSISLYASHKRFIELTAKHRQAHWWRHFVALNL